MGPNILFLIIFRKVKSSKMQRCKIEEMLMTDLSLIVFIENVICISVSVERVQMVLLISLNIINRGINEQKYKKLMAFYFISNWLFFRFSIYATFDCFVRLTECYWKWYPYYQEIRDIPGYYTGRKHKDAKCRSMNNSKLGSGHLCLGE